MDLSGAVVRGARVDLTGTETGAGLSTISNDSGIYRFDAVDLGGYELDIVHPGFRGLRGAGIKVEANRTTRYDPRLEVGTAEARIEGSAESVVMLDKDSPLRGGKFQSREVRDLPAGVESGLARTDIATCHRSRGQQRHMWGRRHRRVLHHRSASSGQQLDAGRNGRQRVWLTGEEQVFTFARCS